MRLTVIGCSGSVSGPDSPASCYLVQAPYAGRTFSLLLDLGPGAFGALYRHLHPRDVDAIALSHLHADHCSDLGSFYVAARYGDPEPWPDVPLYGPTGTAARLAAGYEADPTILPPPLTQFAHHDWAVEQTIGPFRVSTARVAHPVEAYAVRLTEDVEGGRTLVYSGDTGPCPALDELARGADLLLVEAAFPDGPRNPPDLHLSGRQAAQVAQIAGVGCVVLTHIPPWCDREATLAAARPHYSGSMSLASSGASWSV